MTVRAKIQKAYRERRKKSGFTDMRITIPINTSESTKERIRKYAKKITQGYEKEV